MADKPKLLQLTPNVPKPCATTIKFLQGMLERAKRGSITGVYIIAECPDGSFDIARTEPADRLRTMGVLFTEGTKLSMEMIERPLDPEKLGESEGPCEECQGTGLVDDPEGGAPYVCSSPKHRPEE